MDLGLANSTALVTAASRGLGRAVARRLASEGAAVAICARSLDGLTAAATEIGAETGRSVLAVPADVSDPADVVALVARVQAAFGRIDLLVLNAGGPPPGRFLDLAPSDWESATRLTLMSAVRLCYAVVPTMQQQREGSILAISSVSAKQPLPSLVLSNSLRMAVIGMVKTLATELAPFSIRVNSICPGWTRTDRVEKLLRDRAQRNGTTVDGEAATVAQGIPLGRMGTPEEFANAAAFLLSPAASYITGVSLLVDGGLYRGSS